MSIRAEDRPKAFEAQFLSTSGVVSKFGNFSFKPGEIVSEHFSRITSITRIAQCTDLIMWLREDKQATNYANITLLKIEELQRQIILIIYGYEKDFMCLVFQICLLY